MKQTTFRALALAGLVATTFGAQAALTTLSAPMWPPVGSTGLETVEFNVATAGGVTVALGAHGYKNGPLLPNDGIDTYGGMAGIYLPDGLGRANWSFDFAWDLGACSTCSVFLRIDTDPTAAESFVEGELTAFGPVFGESWNMEMAFLGLTFDPFTYSSTGFELVVRDGGADVVSTSITVNVPEPGSLALMGLALAGMAGLRRRKA